MKLRGEYFKIKEKENLEKATEVRFFLLSTKV